MLLLLQGTSGPVPADQLFPESAWSGYFQTIGALLVVLVLLVLVMRYVLPSLPAARHSAGNLITIRGSVALEPRKRIYLIESGGKMLMVASCENTLNLLGTFDAEGFPEAPVAGTVESPFARLLKGRR
ncbi:MAG: flagellar biosynthetic protein FliO [Bryobacterales bacterium]|nr:flagellar biosynthetic protein FliO [Bryobacterales bacterium]